MSLQHLAAPVLLLSSVVSHASELTVNSTGTASTFVDCTITANDAALGGGGIYSDSYSSALVSRTTVCSNTPDQLSGSWTDEGDNIIREDCMVSCDGDIDLDGDVDGADLSLLLGGWGDCSLDDMSADLCAADLNGDGTVDATDLTILLGAWGVCP